MRKPDNADEGLGEDCEEALADVGCNADLYVVNQESTDLMLLLLLLLVGARLGLLGLR